MRGGQHKVGFGGILEEFQFSGFKVLNQEQNWGKKQLCVWEVVEDSR
jgi:hypothetical protein